jgi:hypothetical protein
MRDANQIQLHSDTGYNPHPAICVKYYGPFPDTPELSDAERERVWESVVHCFWDTAKQIAIERGYSGVYSEGRSAGWYVPYYKVTETHTRYADVSRIGGRNRFLAFQREIFALLASVPKMLADECEYRTNEKREAKATALSIANMFD